MIIVDTSVWVEFFKGRQPYFLKLSERLEESQVLAMECIFAELMQGAKNKHEREIINEYWLNLPKYSEQGIFLKAGLESGKNKWFSKGLGLIDSAIIIMARETGSTICTLDKKLRIILRKNESYE
ncbi:MAG: PIN domain-containing protein [Planctomycetota bacterium]